MSDKYIIASIKLPLKINGDGSYIVLSENIEIKFNKHEGAFIPLEVGDKKYACDELTELLASLIPIQQSELLDDCIKKVNSRKNITFKTRIINTNVVSKCTLKNRI